MFKCEFVLFAEPTRLPQGWNAGVSWCDLSLLRKECLCAMGTFKALHLQCSS